MIGRIVVIAFAVLVAVGVVVVVYMVNQPAPGSSARIASAPEPEPTGPKTSPGFLVPKPQGGVQGAPPIKDAATPTPEAQPTTGTLIIESDVPETSVFIDRVYLGNAPVTARNLTPGAHHLNMSVTGYEGVSETIDVLAGTHTLSMKFKELKLDERIDVTHKHAIGSCSGVLRATPQRLAYETTNTADSFAVSLTNLDAFEVDYLQKNLRVKVRAGKTYNFADFEGKVDRLYQFHQTVEKVRQRILAGRRP